MDLTTLGIGLLLALGLLSADAVMHSNSIIVDVTAPPKTDRIDIDQGTLEQEFDTQLFAVANTPSMVVPLEIRASSDQGLGMALAKEAKLQGIAYALQSELGYHPDRLRLAMYLEDGALRGLVSGSSSRVGNFRQVMIPLKDEPLLHFVNRCALYAASQIAPYLTSLYLLQQHASDRDFTDVVALIEQAKSKLPPAPISFDRSAFDNLLGVVALFKNDPKGALSTFIQAIAEDPNSVTAPLNAAFTELVLDDYTAAAGRMEQLVGTAPPSNKVLRATAYMTWAAAEMGMKNIERADELLARAVRINPDSSTALDLLAQVKELKGDKIAAAELHLKAQQSEETFENYGEVAALYFQLSWKDNEPLMRSNFRNPAIVTFH
jgi:tetratricopeptide (TPR) repeat protein